MRRRVVAFEHADQSDSDSVDSIESADRFAASISEYDDNNPGLEQRKIASPVPGLDLSKLLISEPRRSTGPKLPGAVPGSSPKPLSDESKNVAMAKAMRYLNATKNGSRSLSNSEANASDHINKFESPEPDKSTSFNNSSLNLTQVTTSPYNISSSPYEARLGLSSTFADTLDTHAQLNSSATELRAPVVRKLPPLDAQSSLVQVKQSRMIAEASISSATNKAETLISKTDRMAKDADESVNGLDGSSHHGSNVKIRATSNRRAARAAVEDIREESKPQQSEYSQRAFEGSNIGTGLGQPLPRSFIPKGASGKNSFNATVQEPLSAPVAYQPSPTRYFADVSALTDLSPIRVDSLSNDNEQYTQEFYPVDLQELAFAEDDISEQQSDEKLHDIQRAQAIARDTEDETLPQDELDDMDAQAFSEHNERDEQRRLNRREKKRNAFCAICTDIMQDIRTYLKDIECEELLPDCSLSSWRSLLCTKHGRQRIVKPLLLYMSAFSKIVCKLNTSGHRDKDIPTLAVIGLALSFGVESHGGPFSAGPRYNTIAFLALIIAGTYPHFPTKKMSPQILFTLLIVATVILDWIGIFSPYPPPTVIRVLTAIQSVCKIYTLHFHFLQHARGTMKARKYLWRRFRLFLIPLNEPRRIMKDVRGRIMAVGWLQLVATCIYFSTFIASITTFGYQMMSGSHRSGVSLPMFLLFKGISSAAIFIGIILDTDVILALAFFGCFGWNMRYVKKYMRQKREELGGWPYAYFFNSTRYTLLSVVKGIDFLWGVIGWVTVSTNMGKGFQTLESSLRFFISIIALTLVVTDVWVPILMYCINWLLRRHDFMLQTETLSDSDDSELDELGIRNQPSPLKTRAEDQVGLLARQRRERKRYGNKLWADEERHMDSDEFNIDENSDSDTESTDPDLSDDEIQQKRRKRRERERLRRRSRRLALQAYLSNQTSSVGLEDLAEAARLPRDNAMQQEVSQQDGKIIMTSGKTPKMFSKANESEPDSDIDWGKVSAVENANGKSQFASSRSPRHGGQPSMASKSSARDQVMTPRRDTTQLQHHEMQTSISKEMPFITSPLQNRANKEYNIPESEIDFGTYSDPDEEIVTTPADRSLNAFTWEGGVSDIDVSIQNETPNLSFDRANATSRMDVSFEQGNWENITAQDKRTSVTRDGGGDVGSEADSVFNISGDHELNPFEVKALAGGFKRDSDIEDAYDEELELSTNARTLPNNLKPKDLIAERILIAKAQATADAKKYEVGAISSGQGHLKDDSKHAGDAIETQSVHLVLDTQPYIKNDAFSQLWEVLPIAAEFSCRVAALHEEVSSHAVVQHLSHIGFCVVSVGQLSDKSPNKRPPQIENINGFKVFAFASGYVRVVGPKPIFCLMEIAMTRQQPFDESINTNNREYQLNCAVKCSQKEHAQEFIAELSLGDLFHLL